MMMGGGARHSCGTDSLAGLLESTAPHDAMLKSVMPKITTLNRKALAG